MTVISVIVIICSLFHATNVQEHILWFHDVNPARAQNLNSSNINLITIVLPGENRFEASSVARTPFSLYQPHSTPLIFTSAQSQATVSQIAPSSTRQFKWSTSSTRQFKWSTSSSRQFILSTSSPAKKKRLYLPTLVPIPVCGDPEDLIDITSVTTPGRPKIDLFIAIVTAGKHFDRRQAMRQTWLTTAKNYSIVYRFFTDGIDIGSGTMEKLKKEQQDYKDLEFLPTKQGYWFTHRFLHAMFWGYQRYDFSFYLRLDDDYFVCLNNLMNDLQYRKQDKLLYWGWLHCNNKIVNIDEGFLITSKDLVQEIIKRNHSLCCHPMGDQMVAMWINGLDHEGYDVIYFPDNGRLMHFHNHLKSDNSDMCKRILGVHEAYPKQMHRYWSLTKDNWFSIQRDEFVKVERKAYSSYCRWPKGWDWRVLSTHWRHQPKSCWQPGVRWPELERFTFHQGREKRAILTTGT